MNDSAVTQGSHAGTRDTPDDSVARTLIRHWAYPLLWLWVAGCIAWGLHDPDALPLVLATKAGVMVGVLLLLEWKYPYQRRWRMTARHLLRRDLPFIVMNGATFAALNAGLIWLSVDVSRHTTGPMTGQPLWLQVVVGLVAFEALQYSVHRVMHRASGPFAHVLWRTHAIHHLPQQLYVVMHAVFHPFNAVIVRLATHITPLWLLGYDPAAVFVFGSVIAMHGTISHLNLDLRMGLLNYVFVGPELHRYHHSAASHEAQNYAATLSVFDWMLGTFRYRPGVAPDALGLGTKDGYPGQHAPLTSLLFPLHTGPVRPGPARPARTESGT